MKIARKSVVFRSVLAIAAGLIASALSSRAQSASATIYGIAAGGGIWNYTITLHNTGSTQLDGFWYGWIQFDFDLPSQPSNAGNSLGWENSVFGNSIQWIGNNGSSTFGTPLAAGQSATFTFTSTNDPTTITTAMDANHVTSGESVAYVNTIDDSQAMAGDSTGIFSPTLVPAPATLGITTAGSQVHVSWPTNAAGANLQSTASLSSNTWSNVTSGITIVGTNKVFTAALSNSAAYFRLTQ